MEKDLSKAGILLLAAAFLPTGLAAEPPVCTRRLPRSPQPVTSPDLRILGSTLVPHTPSGERRSVLITSDVPGSASGDWLEYEVAEVVPRLAAPPEVRPLFTIEETAEEYVPELAYGDADGDGLTDLFVLRMRTRAPETGAVEFRRAGTGGAFERGPGLSDLSSSTRLVIADIDADRRDELILVDCQVATAYRLGESGWTPVASQSAPFMTQIVPGDLDGDGDDDLVALSQRPERSVTILFGDPLQPLARVGWFPVPFTVYYLGMTFEADADGSSELLLASKIDLSHAVTFHAMELSTDTSQLTTLWDLPLPTGVTYWWPYDIDHDGLDEVILEYDAVEIGSGWSGSHGCTMLVNRGQGMQVLTMRPGAPPLLATRSRGSARLAAIHNVNNDRRLEAVLIPVSGVGLVTAPVAGRFELVEPLGYSALGVPAWWSDELHEADLNHDRFGDLALFYSSSSGWPTFSLLGSGDGRFAVLTGPTSTRPHASRYLHDIDGDGHPDLIAGIDDTLDFRRIVDVAYGRGDGSLAPYSYHVTGQQFQNFVFGDLDGDGNDDLLGNAPWSVHYAWYSPIVVRGRNWDIGKPSIQQNGPAWLLDLDGDRLADPVFEENPYQSGPRRRLLWQRTLPGPRFGTPQEIASWDPTLGHLAAIFDEDLDHDGKNELLLVIDAAFHRTLWTLGRLPGLTFRTLARQAHLAPDATGYTRPDLRLTDVDHDGTLDLSGSLADLRFLRGDGSGRFLTPEVVWNADHQPEFLDVDGDGWLDGIGRSNLGLDRDLAYASTLPYVADGDASPPTVELRLDPLARDLDVPPAFANEWRVVARVEDDCDSAPVTRRQLLAPELPEGGSVVFRYDSREEIRIYGQEGLPALTTVVLTGVDEGAARARWAAVVGAGGFPLDPIHELVLVTSEGLGASPAFWGDETLVNPGLRSSHRFAFEEGKLRLASATYPGADLVFLAAAQDGAGRSTEARRSAHAAREEFCAGSGYVCD